MNSPDFIIIGAGIIGLTTAYELQCEEYDVLLIDRGTAGMEATWAGGGILSPLYPWREKDAVNQLSQWGQKIYPERVHEWQSFSGVDSEWKIPGLLILDCEDETSALTWAGKFQVPIELLTVDSMMYMEPALSPLSGSVTYFPNIAQIRPPRLIRAIRESFLKKGGQLLEHTKVESVLIENNHVNGVKTTQGDFFSKQIILAAGAWTSQLLQPLGLSLPIEPVRGQMILYDAEPELLSRIVIQKQRYLIPRSDGKILAGSSIESTGFDQSTTHEIRNELEQSSVKILNDLKKYPVIKHWAGLRPGSPDGIPFIGPIPSYDGLYINAGHFRNGIQMAPSSARLLTDLILNREPSIDPTPYQFNHEDNTLCK